jgi:hypothetical protein
MCLRVVRTLLLQIGSTILAQAAGVPTLAWSGSGVAISFEECHGDIPTDIYNKVGAAAAAAAAAVTAATAAAAAAWRCNRRPCDPWSCCSAAACAQPSKHLRVLRVFWALRLLH